VIVPTKERPKDTFLRPCPPVPGNQGCLGFGGQPSCPGPGIKGETTYRWRPLSSTLTGSRLLKPPALPEVKTCKRKINPPLSGPLPFKYFILQLYKSQIRDKNILVPLADVNLESSLSPSSPFAEHLLKT